MPTDRRRYRFMGRVVTPGGVACYVWHAHVRGDSRVEEIRCTVEWFWGTDG